MIKKKEASVDTFYFKNAKQRPDRNVVSHSLFTLILPSGECLKQGEVITPHVLVS